MFRILTKKNLIRNRLSTRLYYRPQDDNRSTSFPQNSKCLPHVSDKILKDTYIYNPDISDTIRTLIKYQAENNHSYGESWDPKPHQIALERWDKGERNLKKLYQTE